MSILLIEVLKNFGAEIVGIACIVNRSSTSIEYPLFDAVKLDIESWDPADCPLCKEGIPTVKPGSRAIK